MHKKLSLIGLILFLLIGGYILYIAQQPNEQLPMVRAIGKYGEFSFTKKDVVACQYLPNVPGVDYLLKRSLRQELEKFSTKNSVINIMMGEEMMVEGIHIVYPITSGSFFVWGEKEKLYEFIAPMKCSIEPNL